ncbi:hypothetical protein RRG08_031852 [Elysia crispata]|uniref:Uncharacterized protein n=1 Tax=Elysia crispata TaxID=231223 RepID=A0AAE1A9N1_9GAST|nr:hypothetical protein RRG08_031852 [Elysia crispata]
MDTKILSCSPSEIKFVMKASAFLSETKKIRPLFSCQAQAGIKWREVWREKKFLCGLTLHDGSELTAWADGSLPVPDLSHHQSINPCEDLSETLCRLFKEKTFIIEEGL